MKSSEVDSTKKSKRAARAAAAAAAAAKPAEPVEPVEPLDSFPERIGDFHLIRRLGSGPTGSVYLARQESLSRDVALKVVNPGHLHDEAARAHFRDELEAAARLSHPGIVPVASAIEGDGVYCCTTEVVEGCTLAEALVELRQAEKDERECDGSALAEVVRKVAANKLGRSADASSRDAFSGSWVQCCVRIVRDVARALDHAHRRGVLHRDVKPTNIMIDVRGRARLVDFGIAPADPSPRLLQSGAPQSSLPYMAPERVRGAAHGEDARTDVYSLGVTLYELLALELPYFDPDPRRTRALVLEGDPVQLHEIVPGIAWDVETITLTAIERARDRRYPSAEAFARDLDAFLSQRPIEARRTSSVVRAWRFAEQHVAITLGLLAIVLMLTVAPFAAFLVMKSERDQLAGANRVLEQQFVRAQEELHRARVGGR